ncbi:MAG TPA: M48 family metallopeptidase [Capsulimonadaceae bacterium]|jgi:Zn-dependent protease with chaperone function
MIDPPLLTPEHEAQIRALVHVTPAMLRYSGTMAALSVLFDVIGIALPLAVLATGMAAKIDVWTSRRTRLIAIRAALWWTAFRALRFVLLFPLAWYASYVLPHRYGLSAQSVAAWFGDTGKGWAVNTLIGALVAALVVTLIHRAPRRWPMWLATLSVPLIAASIFAAPLLIDPLFNKFTPLPAASPLHAPIEALARRAGIGDAEIFVVDKSRQTNATNAYVTGLGSSSRIVIWDTLIAKMTPDEVQAVVAHEIGHYAERHVPIGFALAVAALFVALPLVRLASLALLGRYGAHWGITDLAQPAAIPVLLVAASLLGLVVAPISAAGSRYIEHRADAYGLALTGNRAAAACCYIALSRENLSDPYPPLWLRLLLDHPPLAERIDYALRGRPNELWPVPPAGLR